MLNELDDILYNQPDTHDNRRRTIIIKIKVAINKANMTNTELADKLGVTDNAVWFYLNKDNWLQMDTLFKIEDALGINLFDRRIK